MKKKLQSRYARIHKGKSWWNHLSQQDKATLKKGFKKNKQAEKIQKAEIEFNRQKLLNKNELS